MLLHFKKSKEIFQIRSLFCKNLAFQNQPSLKLHNQTDITVYRFQNLFELILLQSFSYRTVVTHLDRSIYCYVFFYLCTAYPLHIIKGYYGPFPPALCWWLKWILNFVPMGILFSFCLNITLRVSTSDEFESSQLEPELELKNFQLDLTWLGTFLTSARKLKISYNVPKFQCFANQFFFKIFLYFVLSIFMRIGTLFTLCLVFVCQFCLEMTGIWVAKSRKEYF